MNDFVARAQPFKILIGILICLAFVAVGVWMTGILDAPAAPPPPSNDMVIFPLPERSSRYPDGFIVVVGWFCVLFFGALVVKTAARLTGPNEMLRINRTGILVPAFSERMTVWADIAQITTWSHRGQKVLIVRLHDPEKYPRTSYQRFWDSVNKGISGGHIGISMTGTDRSLKQALQAVENFRPKA